MSGNDLSPLSGKRILFISHDAIGCSGTASKYYYPLTASLLGAEVAVVGDWGKGQHPFAESIKVFDVAMPRSNGESARKMRSIISEFDPDIVHVFFHRGFGYYLSAPKKTTAIWTVDVRGPLLSRGLRYWVSRILNTWEKRHYDLVSGSSVGSIFSVFGKSTASRASLTRIGVDVTKFVPKAGDRGEVFRLVYVGGIDKRRQLVTLINAFESASANVICTLDIIGDGDDLADLQQYAQKKGIRNVNFIGALDHSSVTQRLPSYDGAVSFIGPSVYNPAPPLKTLEYFAAGLPVVASGTDGNRQLMSDGEEGVLDFGGTAESFSEAIQRLIDHPQLATMREKARSRAEMFSWTTIVSQDLEELYGGYLQ